LTILPQHEPLYGLAFQTNGTLDLDGSIGQSFSEDSNSNSGEMASFDDHSALGVAEVDKGKLTHIFDARGTFYADILRIVHELFLSASSPTTHSPTFTFKRSLGLTTLDTSCDPVQCQIPSNGSFIPISSNVPIVPIVPIVPLVPSSP